MAKHILEFEEDYDFMLLGLASHERNYRLCWEINRILNINLELKPELVFNFLGKKNFVEHTVYGYKNPVLKQSIHLICNQQDNSILVPELRNISYFMKLENVDEENLNTMVELLRSSKLILTAAMLDVEALKSRQKLIF